MFFPGRIAAGVASLIAAAAATALALRGSSSPVVLNQSLSTLSAVASCLLVCAALATMATAPDRRWIAVSAWMLRSWFTSPPSISPRLGWPIIAVAGFCFLATAIRCYGWNRRPIDDQADYLRVAREVHEAQGGPLGLPVALIKGVHLEDNRNPLYVGLLSASPSFEFGRILSEAFCLLTFVAAVGYAGFRFGPGVAALCASLLSVNLALHHSGALVACETLLALLVLVGWIMIAEGWHRSRLGSFLIGAVFGLAYLAKASAAFPFFIVLGWQIWRVIRDAEPKRALLFLVLAAFGFVATTWPLLVRNVRVYGSPLHSFNNRLLFADSYEQGVGEPDLGLAGNWQRFQERHLIAEIVRDRFAGGVVWESFVLLRSLGPMPLDSGRAPVGAALLALAAFGSLMERRLRTGGAFVFAWTAVFVVFFGWYQPIASGDRFLLPLVPPLILVGSAGLQRALNGFKRRDLMKRAVLIVGIAAAGFAIATFSWSGFGKWFPQ